MRIDAYTGNPIIATQQDYYELEELLQEIEPACHSVPLRTARAILEHSTRRPFRSPRSQSATQWVAD